MAGAAFGQAAATGHTVVLAERWATKGDARLGEFASITGMIEVAPDTVWVSDARTSRVIAVSGGGRRSWVVARDGRGPGEVVAPGFLARTPEGEIAVYNRESIEVFAPDGRYVRRVRMPIAIDNVKGFTVLPSGEFVLSGGSMGRGQSVHRLSADGRLLNSWDRIPSTQNPRAGVMVAGGPLQALPDGTILFSRAAPHELLVYRPDGTLVRRVASDPDLLTGIGDDFIVETVERGQWVRSFRWLFPQSRAVLRLRGDTVVNVVDFREQGRSVWEIYTLSGRPIARTVARRSYVSWAITSDGSTLVSYVDPETDEPVAAALRLTVRATGR